VSGDKWVGGLAGWNYSGTITNAYNTGAVSGTNNVGGVAGNNDNGTIINALWANDLSYVPETGKSKPNGAVGNVDDSDTVKGTNLAEMKKAATYDSWTDASSNKIVAKIGNDHKTWRIYEGYTTPFLTSFFKGVVTVRGQSAKTVTYNGTVQTADTGGAVYSLADIDNSHIYLGGSGRNAGTYVLVYSDQQGYDLVNTNTLTINPKNLTATLTGKTGDTYAFTKTYDGKNSVTKELVLGTTYTFGADQIISGDTVRIADNDTGVYADNNVGDGKNAGDDKAITFNSITLTGADAGNYTIAGTLSGNVGQITKKNITASLNALSDVYVFTKTYDGGTDVKQALGTNYSFATGDIEKGDTVSLTAGTSAYTDKNVGDTKEITFGNLVLGDAAAGNYNLTTESLTGNVGQITAKELTITLAGNNAFTKEYDGTTAVNQALAGNYTISGIVGTEKVDIDSAGASGTYADKNAGDNKAITFSSLTLSGTGANNYNLTTTSLSSNAGQITRKTITGTLASGYSFDKVYDGTTTASLGNGYTLSGVAAGDKVPLTAAKGFYDSSAIGDRTVTFSGFSINDGNYLLSMADSLSGTGKITSGSQDRNYSDALTGVSSSFGANPSDGYTIFSGSPEDYVPRAVSQNNGQSYQVGVSQVTQIWYNGPASITIINGGILLPKDILLGSTRDTRTVVLKGGNGYEI